MEYNWSVITYNDFMKVFTDLKKISSDQFSFYLNLAPNYIDITYYFGNLPAERQKYLAMLVLAHLLSLVLRGANGGVGPITNASEGSVSVGFQGFPGGYNWWKQTPYGAMFWSIISRYLSPQLVSGDTGCWM